MDTLINTRIIQIQSSNNPFSFVSTDPDLGQVHRIHLKSVVLPNTEYNLNSKTNKIRITALDMLPVGNIPLGQYNITSFLVALKTVLDIAAAPNTFTVVQSDLTRKLTFTKSGGQEFTIGSQSPSARIIGQHVRKTSIGLSLTSDSLYDLSGLRLVVINSYTLGRFMISGGDTSGESQKNNVLGALPMTAPFGGVLKFESTEATLNATNFNGYKNVSHFDISLLDAAGDLIELNNATYIISLEAHIVGSF